MHTKMVARGIGALYTVLLLAATLTVCGTCMSTAVSGDLKRLLQPPRRLRTAVETRVTTAETAANGHFACLKYLNEHGCPWNEHTVNRALRHGQWECMLYAMRNGAECRTLLCACLLHS